MHPGPPEAGRACGLAYLRFLPAGEPLGGVVVLHGAGSAKESHVDFASRCAAAGLAAVVFDQRGHGESDGALDGRMARDVATVAGVLPPGPVVLRGSSMGGYVALAAAREVGAAGVVAICPASAEGLARGLRARAYGLVADVPEATAFLAAHPAEDLVRDLPCPLLLLHAEADETVPVAHSRRLDALAPGSELVVFPGGSHRSVQHDPAAQARSVDFALAAARAALGR